MKSTGIAIFLTLICNVVTLDLSKFWVTNQTPTVMEPAKPIEIVRWRQPVCVMPAQGVQPCYLALQKLQREYDRVSGHFQEATLRSSAPDAPHLAPLRSSEGYEEAAIVGSRSKTPELPSRADNVEKRRYLGIRGETVPKQQQIYVTRVINAPMTATLVAHTCLPDVGIPLCQDYQPVLPSRPVFDSQLPEIGNPEIKPVNCPNLSFQENQNFPITVNQGLHYPKPIPTTRPGQRPESSLGQAVCHSCVQNDVTSGKFGKIVISKPGGEVEARPQATGGSPFHYFDSASRPDHQITTEFDIQLSKNSGSAIEGEAVDENPRIVDQLVKTEFHVSLSKKSESEIESESVVEEPGTLNHQIKTEFNKQLPNNSGSEVDHRAVDDTLRTLDQLVRNIESSGIEDQGPKAKSSKENKENKKTIREENQPNFLRSPGQQEESSNRDFLGNIVKPIDLFNRKNESTTSRLESASQMVQSSSVSSTSESKDSGIETMKKPAITDILHKPENNISNGQGSLDIFESAESLAKPTEKPGLLGDLFANPVGPIEAENGKVEAEGN